MAAKYFFVVYVYINSSHKNHTMIRTAIIGAGTPAAAELIRILVNHPDVEITAPVQPEYSGRLLSDIHPGLIGDTTVRFVQDFSTKDADQIFICENSAKAETLRLQSPGQDSPRIVDLASGIGICNDNTGFVVGIPELFRKPLVRGARRSAIPAPEITAAMIMLGPLATNMLLSGELKASITLPQDLLQRFDAAEFSRTLNTLLQQFQLSWNGSLNISAVASGDVRGMKVDVELRKIVDLKAVHEIYESVYDDHSFAFTKSSAPEFRDVSGTQKAIFSISSPEEEKMLLSICADPRMRGGAGDAVHVMNLLFALHEKTGLTLKTSSF